MDPNAPGGPGNTTTAPSSTEQQTTAKLDEAEREDSGRRFELFWVNGELGGSYIDMRQFSSDTFQIERANSGGPMFGLGAGVRFVILVLGARARYNALSAFNMWQLNLEAGLKIPISAIDIGFGLHGGYSFVGRLGDAGAATSANTPDASDQVAIRGFNAGLDLLVDYYVSPTFSVGVGAFGDFLFLRRPAVDKPSGFDQLTAEQQAAIENDPLYKNSGTSAGLQLGAALRLGLHFGL